MLPIQNLLKLTRITPQIMRPITSLETQNNTFIQSKLLELPTVGSPTSTHIAMTGDVMKRNLHEDSTQYKIRKNKKLGPDADPYAHTQAKVETRTEQHVEETRTTTTSTTEDLDDSNLVLNQFNDDTSVRPLGSFAEQNVAADRSKIDPLPASKKRRGRAKE